MEHDEALRREIAAGDQEVRQEVASLRLLVSVKFDAVESEIKHVTRLLEEQLRQPRGAPVWLVLLLAIPGMLTALSILLFVAGYVYLFGGE